LRDPIADVLIAFAHEHVDCEAAAARIADVDARSDGGADVDNARHLKRLSRKQRKLRKDVRWL
jgi:hypothetical protein